jgi:hypothetical protein
MFNQFKSYITGTTNGSNTPNAPNAPNAPDTRVFKKAKVIPLVTDKNDTIQYKDLFNLAKESVVGIYNKNHGTKLFTIGVNDKTETIVNSIKIGLYNTTCVFHESHGGGCDGTEAWERTNLYSNIVIDDVVYSWYTHADKDSTSMDHIGTAHFHRHVGGNLYLGVEHENNKLILAWFHGASDMSMSYNKFEFNSETEAKEVYGMIMKFVNPRPKTSS